MTTLAGLADEDLIHRCIDARPDRPAEADEAFEELYKRHVSVTLAFLHRLLPDDEHACFDALQTCFVRFYGALRSFKPGRTLRPWLLTIARNVAIDHLKHPSRREQTLDLAQLDDISTKNTNGAESQLDVAERRELELILTQAVDRLDVDERAIFHLRRELGLSFDEASEVLGCSTRTAKYRMKSALERLGRELERMGLGV
jgi:RNA polymerase sigma-70 factor (ECF subfamily)